MDVIEALKAQIKTKRVVLTKLREEEQELKRLQADVASIPSIQTDLLALERSLAILQGEEAQDAHENFSAKTLFKETAANSVVSVLREAGKPLTLEQIMPLLRVKGASFAEATVRGALYRNIRIARYFKLVGPGTFSLREWTVENPFG